MLIVPCASIRDLFRVNRERGWDDGGIKVQLINSRNGKTVERGFPSKNSPFHLPGEFLWNSSPAPLRITGLRGTYDAGHSYRDSGWQETRFLCCWVPPCRRCTKKRRRIKCSRRVENNGNSRLNFEEEFLLEIVVEKREIVFLEWRKYLLSGFILWFLKL